MLVKIYGMTWVFGIVAAALFFLTGNLTPVIAVAFGFLTFGMIFMGMISVLPSTVGHHAPAPKAVPEKAAASREKVEMFPGAAVHIR